MSYRILCLGLCSPARALKVAENISSWGIFTDFFFQMNLANSYLHYDPYPLTELEIKLSPQPSDPFIISSGGLVISSKLTTFSWSLDLCYRQSQNNSFWGPFNMTWPFFELKSRLWEQVQAQREWWSWTPHQGTFKNKGVTCRDCCILCDLTHTHTLFKKTEAWFSEKPFSFPGTETEYGRIKQHVSSTMCFIVLLCLNVVLASRICSCHWAAVSQWMWHCAEWLSASCLTSGRERWAGRFRKQGWLCV